MMAGAGEKKQARGRGSGVKIPRGGIWALKRNLALKKRGKARLWRETTASIIRLLANIHKGRRTSTARKKKRTTRVQQGGKEREGSLPTSSKKHA